LRAALDAVNDIESVELLEMPWMLRTSLPRLLDQARNGGYSTFRFYTPEEFEGALGAFRARVRASFDNLSTITAPNDHLGKEAYLNLWDENFMGWPCTTESTAGKSGIEWGPGN
jgi:hypothetical protein